MPENWVPSWLFLIRKCAFCIYGSSHLVWVTAEPGRQAENLKISMANSDNISMDNAFGGVEK